MMNQFFVKFFILIALTLGCSFAQSADMCVALLDVSNIKDIGTKVSERTEVLDQEMKALEVLAALTLSLELSPDSSILKPGKFLKNKLGKGKYSSIERISPEDIGTYDLGSYNFNSITTADRNHIIDNLIPKMKELVSSAKVGKNFDKHFDAKLINEVIDSKADALYVLLRDEAGLNAIILNALNLPRRSLGSRVKAGMFRSAKVIGTISIVMGILSELFIPNFAAVVALDPILNGPLPFMTDPLPIQGLAPDIIKEAQGFSSTQRYFSSMASYIPVGAATVTLMSFLKNTKPGRFNALNYDFSYGKDARDYVVDQIIEKDFPDYQE